MSNLFDFGANPLFVWGLYPRLVGLVFLVSFTSLIPQMIPSGGGTRPCR